LTGKPTDYMAASADWGTGVTRRAFRLRGHADHVEAALEDMYHAMICTLRHDGKVVTAVEADFRRYTLQLCPGASEPLKQIVGMPLSTSTRGFFANGRARQNCTHMLDLAWLALRHASRGQIEWLYEVEIPDALSGPVRGTLRRNSEVVQDWTVERNIIVSPPALAGQALAGGFTKWVTTNADMPEQQVEECLVLHKGFFMMGARQFMVPEGPLPDAYRNAVRGVCFGYASERIDGAEGLKGMKRDFSHHPKKMLRFE
jgi:hypothetical protein